MSWNRGLTFVLYSWYVTSLGVLHVKLTLFEEKL